MVDFANAISIPECYFCWVLPAIRASLSKTVNSSLSIRIQTKCKKLNLTMSTPESRPKWILAPRLCIENTSVALRRTRTVWELSSPRVEILIGPFVLIRFISSLKKWSLQRQFGDASRGVGFVEIPTSLRDTGRDRS